MLRRLDLLGWKRRSAAARELRLLFGASAWGERDAEDAADRRR